MHPGHACPSLNQANPNATHISPAAIEAWVNHPPSTDYAILYVFKTNSDSTGHGLALAAAEQHQL
jgi:hypothetical protein